MLVLMHFFPHKGHLEDIFYHIVHAAYNLFTANLYKCQYVTEFQCDIVAEISCYHKRAFLNNDKF